MLSLNTVAHLKYVFTLFGKTFITKFPCFCLASISEFTTDLAKSVSLSVRAASNNSTHLSTVNRNVFC